MAKGRKAVHAYLTSEAHQHWQHAAQAWGVSVSALVESIASELDQIESLFENGDPTIVRNARRIDSRRRRPRS